MDTELPQDSTPKASDVEEQAVVETTEAAESTDADVAEQADSVTETVVDEDSADVDSDEDEDDEDDDDEDSDESDAGSGGGMSKLEQMELETEIAADYLEELMDIADFDGDIDTFVEGGRPCVSILGGADKLVGPHGKVLDALQELSRLAVMTETGHRSRLMLDISGYRDKRRKELEEMGHDAVAEVKETGESVRLTPMNAFERKIVHDIVAVAGLVSESEGQEPQRRVVVQPK